MLYYIIRVYKRGHFYAWGTPTHGETLTRGEKEELELVLLYAYKGSPSNYRGWKLERVGTPLPIYENLCRVTR